MNENNQDTVIQENFLKTRTAKVSAIIAIIVIIIFAASVSVYKTEKSNLFYNINTNISNLNSTINGFYNGLNTNEELLNPSFAKTYENNFTTLSNSLNENSSNILNTASTKKIASNAAIEAEYYNYIAQFVGEAVNYKNDFAPLTNIINNGGKLTDAEATQMENDINTLENSQALTDAMNLYNSENISLNSTVNSPYLIKQRLINLDNDLKNGKFNSSTKSNTNINNNSISSVISALV